MSEYDQTIESSPEHETAEIIGNNVLRMVDQLEFIPDCNAKWEIELDDIEFEIIVQRKK